MNISSRTLAVAAISAVATAQLMSTFTPSLYELRDHRRGVPNRQGLHEALLIGGGIAVAIGILGSIATQNVWPLLSAVFGAGFLFLVYEWAIKHPHGGE